MTKPTGAKPKNGKASPAPASARSPPPAPKSSKKASREAAALGQAGGPISEGRPPRRAAAPPVGALGPEVQASPGAPAEQSSFASRLPKSLGGAAPAGGSGAAGAAPDAGSWDVQGQPPSAKRARTGNGPAFPPAAAEPGAPAAAAEPAEDAGPAAAPDQQQQPNAEGAEGQPRLATVDRPSSAALAAFPADVVRMAALIRRMLGLQRGQAAHLRMVMKTNVLGGQALRFQNRAGKTLLTGAMNMHGSIDCDCARCNGKPVSASEFEDHAGSRDRRPADGIFMQASNTSLKELLGLVNSMELASTVDVHMDACYVCKQAGDLLCCDGCTAVYHLPCVSLAEVPKDDWFCSLCVQEGRTVKEIKPLLPPPKAAAKAAMAAKSGGGGASSSKAGGGGGSKAKPPGSAKSKGYATAGRVHMSAPALRRPGGRPARSSNKHKRLFDGVEGGLKDGEVLAYITTQGEKLLDGVAVIDPAGLASGIRCACCDSVISASQFEAHAGRAQRRAPYDNIFNVDGITLKAMAALLPDLEGDFGGGGGYGLDDIADGCRDVLSELDTLAGGCVLCHEPDFARGEFGPRTIMLCDQCEREFHVGCLRTHGREDLDALPQGDWFCSPECGRIHTLLASAVERGAVDLEASPAHSLQVLCGKDGRVGTAWAIRAAADVLQEGFDPIMDLASDTDLLPLMLYARSAGEWDYSKVHTLLLRHRGKPVVAALVRIFGPHFAELPLIATRSSARRQGHARVLVDEFEAMLRAAGVHTLVLPAAHETVETWKGGFGFHDMPEEQIRLCKQQLRILIFPGTEVLCKQMAGVPEPRGHHVLVELPERPALTWQDREVASLAADMVAEVAAAGGEAQPKETRAVGASVAQEYEAMLLAAMIADAEALPRPPPPGLSSLPPPPPPGPAADTAALDGGEGAAAAAAAPSASGREQQQQQGEEAAGAASASAMAVDPPEGSAAAAPGADAGGGAGGYESDEPLVEIVRSARKRKGPCSPGGSPTPQRPPLAVVGPSPNSAPPPEAVAGPAGAPPQPAAEGAPPKDGGEMKNAASAVLSAATVAQPPKGLLPAPGGP